MRDLRGKQLYLPEKWAEYAAKNAAYYTA